VQHARGEVDDVRRASGGDAGAFRRLYDAHVGRVHALALRMAGPEVAEDMTQEVFIRAWQRLHTFRGEARFGTWLHRLAVRHLLSARTRRRRREERQVAGDGILERAAAPPGRRTAVALDLEAAIRTLPEGAREVFVLYDVEGYRHKEIAELMGISVGTSKSQLHRARMLLRRRLDGGCR
jgi:RNA polymerase sigma-70 factor (ECF subfamily)